MIIMCLTVACENEEIANRIQLLMPSADSILREEGVINVSLMWTSEEDEED